MKGFILSLIALLLFFIFFIPAFLWQLIRDFRSLNNYFYHVAVATDKFCNVFCNKIMDDVMLTRKSIHFFGSTSETISSVLGKNKADQTLTIIGTWMSNLLDSLQKNHVELAVQNDLPKDSNI